MGALNSLPFLHDPDIFHYDFLCFSHPLNRWQSSITSATHIPNIGVFDKTPTMKFNGYFDQGFTAQTVSSIHRSNGCLIWGIPDSSGIAAGIAFVIAQI